MISFDTSDLDISAVEVDGTSVTVSVHEMSDNRLTFMQYNVKPKHPVMGSALYIPLPKCLKIGSSVSAKITYKTTAESTALQWLDREYVINLILSKKMLTKKGQSDARGISISLQSMPTHPCPFNCPFARSIFYLFKILFTSSSSSFHSSRYFFIQNCTLIYHTGHYLG